MNLIGNIDLSNETDFQSVYASQLYGTFFMIYAKFKSKQKTKYELENIELKLLNYKGLINLGLKRAKFIPEIDDEGNTNGGNIIVEVQALESNTHIQSVNNVKGNKCNINDILKVDRRVAKLTPSGHIKNNVIDEEFIYREGFERDQNDPDNIQKMKTRFVKMSPAPYGDYDTGDSIGSGAAGFICPRSENIITR
ncbi:MAG: hypothetical protein KAJ28_04060 [Flavobacteriaceae bacterium]|nr:hypothetical protein [Flavobacteriaceae bacterium]